MEKKMSHSSRRATAQVTAAAYRAAPSIRKRPVNREHAEQVVLCEWLDLRHIEFFATISGAYFGGGEANKWGRVAHARKLKEIGWKPGVPDIILLDQWYDPDLKARRPVTIELKREDGGVVSDAQLDMHAIMAARGWVVLTVYGAKAAIDELSRMGF